MTTLKPRPDSGQTLAALAWAAVALTPVGWFYGFLAFAYSHLGDVTDVGMMTGGVALFAAAPTSAFILAVYTARAGHRSGKIAVIVSGLLLLATLAATFVFTLMNGEWIGQAVAMAVVVAVLVLAWVLSRGIAVVMSGLLLLTGLGFSAWHSGGWINVAVIAVMAVVAVLIFAWARSRSKPPPGPDGCGARRDRGRLLHRRAHPEGLHEFARAELTQDVRPHPGWMAGMVNGLGEGDGDVTSAGAANTPICLMAGARRRRR